jgi:hypothetical protein
VPLFVGFSDDWRLIVPLLLVVVVVVVVVLFLVVIIPVGGSRRHRVIYGAGKPPGKAPQRSVFGCQEDIGSRPKC